MDLDRRSDATFIPNLNFKVKSRKRLTLVFFSLMIFSCVTLLFELLSCSLDQFVSYSVKDRVTAPMEDGGSILLIPKISVNIGFVTACIGNQCVSRSDPAIPSSFAKLDAVYEAVSSDIATAYASVRDYFNVGYNFGEACASNRDIKAPRQISKLALASQILSIILLFCAVSCCVSILVQLRSRSSLYYSIDFSDGITESFSVVEDLDTLLKVLLAESNRHWYTVMGLYATVLLNFVFSLSVMSSFLGLFFRPGCLNGFCSSFEDAMNLLELEDGMDPIGFSCSRGNSFKLSIVSFALSTALAIAIVCLFLFFFFEARRRQVQEYISHLLEIREIKEFQLASAAKKINSNPLSDSFSTMMIPRMLFSVEHSPSQHRRHSPQEKRFYAQASIVPSEAEDNELSDLAEKGVNEEGNRMTSVSNLVGAAGEGNETQESIVPRGNFEDRSIQAVLPEAHSQRNPSIKIVELLLSEEEDRSEIYRAAQMDLFLRIRRMDRVEKLPGLHAFISSLKTSLSKRSTTGLPLFHEGSFSSATNPIQATSTGEFVDAVAGDSVWEASFRGRRNRI